MIMGSSRLSAWGIRCRAASVRAADMRISGLFPSASAMSSSRRRVPAAAARPGIIERPTMPAAMERRYPLALIFKSALLRADMTVYWTSTLNLAVETFLSFKILALINQGPAMDMESGA